MQEDPAKVTGYSNPKIFNPDLHPRNSQPQTPMVMKTSWLKSLRLRRGGLKCSFSYSNEGNFEEVAFIAIVVRPPSLKSKKLVKSHSAEKPFVDHV